MLTRTETKAVCDICGCDIAGDGEGCLMVEWETEGTPDGRDAEPDDCGQRFLCERCAAADCIDGDDNCMGNFWASNLCAEHPGAEVIYL